MPSSPARDPSTTLRRRTARSEGVARNTNTQKIEKPIAFEEKEKKNINTADSSSSRSDSDSGSNRRALLILVLVLLCTLGLSFLIRGQHSRPPRTYALCSREGNIYTVDTVTPRAECIVVHDSRILSVGTLDETRKRFGDSDTSGPGVLAAKFKAFKNGLKFYFIEPGHAVVPGLADSHAHLLEQGFKSNLEVGNTSSASDVLEKVKAYVKGRPEVLKDRNIWIQGWGWDQTKWPGAEFPTAAEFDADPLLRGRPMLLHRVDGHAIWTSQRVIEEAGDLPREVEGGSIIRYENGNPTGVFVDNAMDLIQPPAWTEKQTLQFYLSAVKEAISYGLTSIHDAGTTAQAADFFKKVADANKLPLRLYLMHLVNPDDDREGRIERYVNYGPAARLTLRSIKLMSDGALGSWGAALIEPYTDRPDVRGTLLSSPQVLSHVVTKFWDDGFQVNIHCIGDLANNVVLNIFEEKLRNASVAVHRPRIEHAQIMTAPDLDRTARLGVIASVQPTHATSDMWYAETRLGPERIKSAYAYKTLLEKSERHVLPLGSDFPVEGVNPLLGFYAVVTRLSESGDSPHGVDGWFPEQRLTREEALKGMTLDAAYASFSEDELGSLSPGKRADFVVLDTNIMTVPPQLILQTRVIATVVDGRPVFGKL